MGLKSHSFTISRVFAIFLLVSGCGYTLQGSKSALLEKQGIHRIYVKPLVNNSYKPGVENVVYNALIRTMLSHRRVVLVQHETDADAVLQGTINQAEFGVSAPTLADQLPPQGLPPNVVPPNVSIASEYRASLNCDFILKRPNPPPGRKAIVWNATFARSKPFPASNQLDVPGTTSALINESEFERAISEIAVSMMDDVHESMLAMF